VFYLLHGPDTYRSRKKLNEIIEEYRKKAGSNLNFHRFDAEEHDLVQFKSVIETQSLFSPKKLVVVERAVAGGMHFFSTLLEVAKQVRDSREIMMVLWDGELSEAGRERLARIKPLIHKVQGFKSLSRASLRQWIREEAQRRGAKLAANDVIFLESLGSDLWRIANELEKLASGGGSGDRSPLFSAGDEAIFRLGDVFFASPREALGVFLELSARGHDEMRIFSYLNSHTRTICRVKSCMDEGRPLSALRGIHPYVIKKASAIAGRLSFAHLEEMLGRFFQMDCRLKTGLESPRDALLHLIMRLS